MDLGLISFKVDLLAANRIDADLSELPAEYLSSCQQESRSENNKDNRSKN